MQNCASSTHWPWQDAGHRVCLGPYRIQALKWCFPGAIMLSEHNPIVLLRFGKKTTVFWTETKRRGQEMPRWIWIPVPDLGLACFGDQDLCRDFGEEDGDNRSHCSQTVFMPWNLGDEQQKSDPAITMQTNILAVPSPGMSLELLSFLQQFHLFSSLVFMKWGWNPSLCPGMHPLELTTDVYPPSETAENLQQALRQASWEGGRGTGEGGQTPALRGGWKCRALQQGQAARRTYCAAAPGRAAGTGCLRGVCADSPGRPL